MSTQTAIPQRTIARRSRTGVIFGLTPAATAVTLVGLGAIFLSILGVFPMIVGLSVATVTIPLGVVRWNGRQLIGWLPIVGVYLYRRATGHTRFTRPLTKPRVSASLGLPGDAARLRLIVDEHEVAYLHDPHARHLTFTLRVTHGGTILLDPERQLALDNGFGDLLDGIARFDEDIARVQIIERTLPSGGGLLKEYVAARSGDLVDTQIGQVYESLIAKQGESLRHESLIAVTLDLAGAQSRIREMGGGIAGAVSLAHEVMLSLQGSIQEAGLTSAGWLSEADLALMIRSVYDPESIPRLAGATVGRRATSAGPMGMAESWTHVQTDSAWHQVLQITEWPRTGLGLMGMWPLILTPGVQRTFSLILKPVPVSKSRRQARTKVSDSQIERERKARRRGFDDPEHADEVEEARKRLQEVTLLGAREFEFIGLVMVSAPDHDTLRKEVRKVLTNAQQADLELRPLAGQQAQHLPTAGLPLGRGL